MATESTNIVKILDNLYRVFDQICLETSNQKIEVRFINNNNNNNKIIRLSVKPIWRVPD